MDSIYFNYVLIIVQNPNIIFDKNAIFSTFFLFFNEHPHSSVDNK